MRKENIENLNHIRFPHIGLAEMGMNSQMYRAAEITVRFGVSTEY